MLSLHFVQKKNMKLIIWYLDNRKKSLCYLVWNVSCLARSEATNLYTRTWVSEHFSADQHISSLKTYFSSETLHLLNFYTGRPEKQNESILIQRWFTLPPNSGQDTFRAYERPARCHFGTGPQFRGQTIKKGFGPIPNLTKKDWSTKTVKICWKEIVLRVIKLTNTDLSEKEKE